MNVLCGTSLGIELFLIIWLCGVVLLHRCCIWTDCWRNRPNRPVISDHPDGDQKILPSNNPTSRTNDPTSRPQRTSKYCRSFFLMTLTFVVYSCFAIVALSYLLSIVMTNSFALFNYKATVPIVSILVFVISSITCCYGSKSKGRLCATAVCGLAIIFAVLFLHSEYHPCHRTVESDHSTQDRVTTVLKATVHALENNNITYWANGGTLLGAYLNHSVIAWDYDADLFLPCTLRTLEKIRWGDYGLVSYTGWDGMVRIKSSRFSSIRIDLFFVHFRADGRQWFNDDHINMKYPKENLITINDVYPLRLYNMTMTSVESGFQVWGPSHPEIVLKKLYPGRSTKLDRPKTTGGIFRYLELQMFTRFGNVLMFKESTFPGKHTLSVAHLLLHNRAVLVRENNINK